MEFGESLSPEEHDGTAGSPGMKNDDGLQEVRAVRVVTALREGLPDGVKVVAVASPVVVARGSL